LHYHHIACVFLLTLGAAAQGFRAGVIEGQLSATQGSLPDRLSIEVVAEGRVVDRTDAARDGSFTFRNLDAGQYEIRVVDVRANVIRTDFVAIGPQTGRLEFRLPGLREERPASGTISLRALTKPTPAAARKALIRSQAAFARGDIQQAFEHLLTAKGKCLECPEVHNNLGALYMKTGAFENAAFAFSTAVELDPSSSPAQTNLALALITLGQYAQAEAPARKGLELDAGSTAARYAIGLIALAKRECTPEALYHLRAASSAYPRAHLSAAAMFVCRGERAKAVHELIAYLGKPNPEQRQRVERWLAELNTAAAR
jgi:tetratricopeptide (TPR) repeat protein